jgi:hypothetical protein
MIFVKNIVETSSRVTKKEESFENKTRLRFYYTSFIFIAAIVLANSALTFRSDLVLREISIEDPRREFLVGVRTFPLCPKRRSTDALLAGEINAV